MRHVVILSVVCICVCGCGSASVKTTHLWSAEDAMHLLQRSGYSPADRSGDRTGEPGVREFPIEAKYGELLAGYKRGSLTILVLKVSGRSTPIPTNPAVYVRRSGHIVLVGVARPPHYSEAKEAFERLVAGVR